MFSLFALSISAYLCGSILGALVVQRLTGLDDPRRLGSGNPGATNMLRNHGKFPAIATLVIDVIKVFPALLLAKYLQLSPTATSCIALCALLGHLFPIFFKFKGGKGVATALGIAIMLNTMLALTLLTVWLGTYKISKDSSVAALVTATCAPVLAYMIATEYWPLLGIIGLILILTHKDNMRNLLAGTELSTANPKQNSKE